MPNYYQFIIPRMDGETIERDIRRHLALVKKGIGGFIVFGGELSTVRRHIRVLQQEAPHPLVIASDLERGLGQQLRGGTNFPPAMALTSAVAGKGVEVMKGKDRVLLRSVFAAVAEEAAYAGINTVFAPVLDINTNPRNPIIAARAFGEDRETVSFMGCEMVRVFQRRGIATCGKHFPGHGDTSVDSHIRLPAITRSLSSLKRGELLPFRRAVESGVPMIMLGHLSVACLDPAGTPVSLSAPAVSFLREEMGFDGVLITDAMNMGGLAGYQEDEACLMALRAGVDIILHPLDPDGVAARLRKERPAVDSSRLDRFRRGLLGMPVPKRPDFRLHRLLSEKVTGMSVRSEGVSGVKDPFLLVLNDDEERRGQVLAKHLRKLLPRIRIAEFGRGEEVDTDRLGGNMGTPVVAIFSETKGWKGGAGAWLFEAMRKLDRKDAVFISFGSPYILDGIKKAAKVYAYWDGDEAQKAVAALLVLDRRHKGH